MSDEPRFNRIRALTDGHPLIVQMEMRKAVESRLESIGIKRKSDGGVELSADAIRTIRLEREARATMSRVPSTPRWNPREASGVGVRKGAGQWGTISMEMLRRIRERAPILQAIHAARHQQIRRMAVKWSGRRGDVGWRVVHKDHNAHNAKPPKGFEVWIKQFERVLEKPAPSYGYTSTGALLGGLEEDLLTINRPVCEVLYSAIDKTRIVGLKPVDGAIIWPTQVWMDKWINEHPDWYGNWSPGGLSESDALDLLSQQMRLDLRVAEHCLVRDGVVEATYTRDQLIVAPAINRTSIEFNGYWPSNVEQAIEIILTFINTWDYNASYFTRGMMAEFILGISGNVHDDDVDAFADMFREATQGVRRSWQPPMIPLPEGGEITKIDLKSANKDMMMEVFMSLQAALATAIYRMDPSTINCRPWDGGGKATLGGDSGRGDEIALAKEEGLAGDLQHICETTLTPTAQRCHPDLVVMMEYGNVDPQKEAAIYEVRSRVSMTRNEVRLEEGMAPMGFWVEPDKLDSLSDEDREKYEQNLWNMPADQGFVSAMTQKSQMAQQMQQMQQIGGQGQPGDDEPPPDDGYGEPDGNDDGFGQPKPTAPFGAPGQASAPTAPSAAGQPPQPMQKGRRLAIAPRRRRTVYVETLTE